MSNGVRFLTPTLHGVVDYLAAAGLIIMPFVLGLGASSPLAKWLAVGTGFAVVVASMLTDYKLGALRVLPFRGHLAVDTAVAVLFLAAPSLFGFTGLDAWYYWINAAAVFVVVGLSRPEPSAGRQAATA